MKNKYKEQQAHDTQRQRAIDKAYEHLTILALTEDKVLRFHAVAARSRLMDYTTEAIQNQALRDADEEKHAKRISKWKKNQRWFNGRRARKRKPGAKRVDKPVR